MSNLDLDLKAARANVAAVIMTYPETVRSILEAFDEAVRLLETRPSPCVRRGGHEHCCTVHDDEGYDETKAFLAALEAKP